MGDAKQANSGFGITKVISKGNHHDFDETVKNDGSFQEDS